MLLGIDIGNKSIYFGAINDENMEKTFRITTNKNITIVLKQKQTKRVCLFEL